MYEKLLKALAIQYPDFPKEPSLDLGLAIKQIRLRMGMTQNELARDAKLKPAALKTLENGYAKFTKNSNLSAIAQVLRIQPHEILLEAREWFPGNFFALKLGEGPQHKERRKKYRAEVWFKKKLLAYDGWRVSFFSPPPHGPGSFCFACLELDPDKSAGGFKLSGPSQVAGFVQRGSLKIRYEQKDYDLFGNQGFALRGDKPHSFSNMDPDNPLRLFLAFGIHPSHKSCRESPATQKLNIGHAISQIRHLYSDAKSRPLSFNELSYLTGIEENSLQYLENTTGDEQVIYWDKIEKITQALKMPFARFLDLAQGKDPGYFYLATALDRALIDYRHYLGVRIKSAVFPGTHNEFHLSEMYIEPKGGIRRISWNRKDDAKIAIYVEDGELRVEVGKNRKTTLKTDESIYFDASLGYIFTNPGLKPCKLHVAAYPPLIF